MKLMKIGALLLSAVMAAGAFSSCGKDENTDESSKSEVAVSEKEESSGAYLELPDGRFLEGETFNLYYAHNGFSDYYCEDVAQGDILGEAVMKRNNSVVT